MKYEQLDRIYSEINSILEEFIRSDRSLEDDYYIKGARNILRNRINIYIDHSNFAEIDCFYENTKNGNLNILDLGCGLGDKSIVLKRIFNKSSIYGLETTNNDDSLHKSNPPYRIFEKLYPILSQRYGITLGLFDGYNVQFPDEFFDIVVLYAVIEHINPENRKRFIDNISRKIKSNGSIVVTRCPRLYSLTEFMARELKMGSHEWVLRKKDLLDLFDKKAFDFTVLKCMSNIPANPPRVINRIARPLICLDKILSFVKWPFSSDYFAIVRRR